MRQRVRETCAEVVRPSVLARLFSVPDALVASKRTDLARQICVLYQEALRSAFGTVTQGKQGSSWKTTSLDDLDAAAHKEFLRAALVCWEMRIDPREFIVSQFSAWKEASSFHGKLLLPSPHHLGTLAARVRYVRFKEREEIRSARVMVADEYGNDEQRWFVEERKLKGLARMQRRSTDDVLTEQPEQFSSEFLKHKRVWSVVQDLWDERQGARS